MARKPVKAAAKAARDPVIPDSGVPPLCALHQIVYGNAQVAVPGSLFVPASETERNEILGVDEHGKPVKGRDPAGRELNEVELLMAEKMGIIGDGATPTPTPAPTTTEQPADTTAETPAADSDVIE